jgi:hypothetical protein
MSANLTRLAKAVQESRTTFGDPEPTVITVNGRPTVAESIPTLFAPGTKALRELDAARVAVLAEAKKCELAIDALMLLRAAAETEHAKYPQYDHYWDDYGLARLPRSIKFKSGEAKRGDLVLCSARDSNERSYWRIYNVRSGMNCALPRGYYMEPIIEGWEA